MTEREFIRRTGAGINKVKAFRKENMQEGVDYTRGGWTGREVIYTLDGEAKIQAWFDESQEGFQEKVDKAGNDEWTGVVRRVINARNMHVDSWDGRIVSCFVPFGFRVNVGERVPIRQIEDKSGRVALDIDRCQKDRKFIRALKQIKAARARR